MESQLSEDVLGNPNSVAEHAIANIGMSSLLKGEMGPDYNPKDSPFAGVPKQAQRQLYTETFPKEPEKAAALDTLNRMKDDASDNIDAYSKNLFEPGMIPASQPHSAKEFHELYDHIEKLNQAPENLMQHLANQTSPISDHAPNTTIALSALGSKASQILQQVKPNLMQKSPLDGEKKANPLQIATFNKAAGLIDKPLTVFSKLKEGTLTNSDINLMRQVYPNLLSSIQEKVFKNMAQYDFDKKEPLDYNMKLGLSRLLGQPMDSSLKALPQNQMALQGMNMAKAQTQVAQPKTRASKMGIGKMKVSSDETRYQQATTRKA